MIDRGRFKNSKKRLKKQQKNLQDKLRLQVQCSYQIIKNVQERNLFYIFGDTIIDVDQLLSLNQVQFLSPQNEFRKTVYVSRRKDVDVAESVLDINVQGQTNLYPIINQLQKSQNIELMHLSKLLENYHNLIHQNVDINNYYHSNRQLAIDSDNQQFGNEWNYKKSLEKAYQSINEMSELCKSSNSFLGYIILQGNQYEQVKSVVATPMTFLREFMCMSDEQIDYILLRNPIVFPTIMVNQFVMQTIRKVNELIFQFKVQNNNLDMFRQKPVKVSSSDFDVKSVDNFKVELFQEIYIHVLSNYTDKKDDLIYLFKLSPKSIFKAEDILQSQRLLKKDQISTLYSSSSNNTAFNDSSSSESNKNQDYVDIRYQAQSEIFKEKYYSLIDNEAFHEINDLL